MPVDHPPAASPNDQAALLLLGEVRAQLSAIQQMMQHNAEATNRRIDDMTKAIGQRMDDHGNRISRLEDNERGTAIKASSIGALAGSGAALLVQAAIKSITGGH